MNDMILPTIALVISIIVFAFNLSIFIKLEKRRKRQKAQLAKIMINAHYGKTIDVNSLYPSTYETHVCTPECKEWKDYL